MKNKERIEQLEQQVSRLEGEVALLKLHRIQKKIVPYPVSPYPMYPQYPQIPWIQPQITWCDDKSSVNFQTDIPKEVIVQ